MNKRKISFSKLRTYSQCPEKLRLKFIEQVEQEPSGAMIGGIAVHETIRWFETSQTIDFELATADQSLHDAMEEKFLEVLWGLLGEEDLERIRWGGRDNKENADWWELNGPIMLRRYLSVRATDVFEGWSVVEGSVEQWIEYELPSGVLLVGKIDKILFADPDGVATVRDYKTGTWREDNPMQLASNSWLIEQATGISARRGQYVYLRSADASERTVNFDLEPFLPLVVDFYARQQVGISARVYPYMPSKLCSVCEVRKHCKYGQAMEGEKT